MPHSSKYDAHGNIAGTKSGNRVVLTPESSLTHENCSDIKKRIEEAISQNKIEIILNFKAVALLDSAALEMLVQTHAELRRMGGALKIVGLSEVCRDILLTTRIMNLLFVYDNVHEAIKHNP